MNTQNTQNTPGPQTLDTEVKLSRDRLLLGKTVYAALGTPAYVTLQWNPIARQLEIRAVSDKTSDTSTVQANASGTARLFARSPIAQSGAAEGIYHADMAAGVLTIAIPDGWQSPLAASAEPPSFAPPPLILSLPQVAVLCDVPHRTVYHHVKQGYAATLTTIGGERTAQYMTIEHLNAYRAWRSLPPLTREEIEHALT